MYLGESSLFFFSVAALQALLQPVDRFLNVCFPFMLFKMWHLESFLKERCQQFSGGLSSARTRQGEANAEPSRGQITATFSHGKQGSVMGCRGHFIKFFSVLCKVCIQNTTRFTEKKKLGSSVEQMRWVRTGTIARHCMVRNAARWKPKQKAKAFI